MSLYRFLNIDVIQNSNSTTVGRIFDLDKLKSISYLKALIDEYPALFKVDAHLYDSSLNLFKSIYNLNYEFDSEYDDFFFDVSKAMFDNEVYSGVYKICFNFYFNLFGEYSDPPLIIEQKSPDELEAKITPRKSFLERNPNLKEEFTKFKKLVEFLKTNNNLNNVSVNFGSNFIHQIVNIKVDCEEDLAIYVKFLSPLSDREEGNSLYFSFKLLEDYIDTFTLSSNRVVEAPRVLRGPNYSTFVSEGTGESTIFKSWDTLLDTDSQTSQRLIESILSGSESIPLNIDYSYFDNFVFYGSASERLKNYNYKRQLIEYYTSQSNNIDASSNVTSSWGISSKSVIQKRIDSVTSNFDNFEKYLHYETGSLFSYDISGSMVPAPKYINNNRYVNYHITSSQYNYWYSSSLAYADNYDRNNLNRLYELTPGHIVNDSNNSEYFLFLDMIGHHFDNVYSYVKELTSIHRRDEHPNRGIPNELLRAYAESLGWDLNNGYRISDLWLYKLGVDSTGSYSDLNDLPSKSYESITHQVWRRIVNNMPYLLKTKGTERGVRALFSIYGIPNTLISYKEYGGPRPDTTKPIYKEDKFQYLLKFDGNSYIRMPRNRFTPYNKGVTTVPIETEFRFRTTYSSSVSMSMWAIQDFDNPDNILHNLEIVSYLSESTSSYSGSYGYGYFKYTSTEEDGLLYSPVTVSSSYYPIFDGDVWTVRIYSDGYVTNSNNTPDITIEWMKSSADFDSRISFSGSLVYSPTNPISKTWGANTLLSATHSVILGGATGSSLAGADSKFSGSLQAYREYSYRNDKSVFESHVLNPGAYQGNTYTSSFNSLVRYYTMGVDSMRHDHTQYTQVSSSHPNQKQGQYTTASFIDFSGTQSDQYESFSEKVYSHYPSIGANIPKSEKIRIESSTLKSDLSPVKKSTENEYDTSGTEKNRLAIVFSPTDQSNRDISNQFGGVRLDDWIGDPTDLYKDEYSNLTFKRQDYWKKYTRRNDYNKYIEIFSLFDYSVFEQLKNLVPARANLISGVLLEDTILERPRVRRKLPQVSTHYYEKELLARTDRQDGDNFIMYTGSIDQPLIPEIVYQRFTSSIQEPLIPQITYQRFTSSIQEPLIPQISHQRYSGSISRVAVIGPDSGDFYGVVTQSNGTIQMLGDCIRTLDYVRNLNSCKGGTSVLSHYTSSNGFASPLSNVISTNTVNFSNSSVLSYFSGSLTSSFDAVLVIPNWRKSQYVSINGTGVISHYTGSDGNPNLIEDVLVRSFNILSSINSHVTSSEGRLVDRSGNVSSLYTIGGEDMHSSGSVTTSETYSFVRNGISKTRVREYSKPKNYEGVSSVYFSYNQIDNRYSYNIENKVGHLDSFDVDGFYDNSDQNYSFSSSFNSLMNTSMNKKQLKNFISRYKYIIDQNGNVYQTISGGEIQVYVSESRVNPLYKKLVYHYSSSVASNYSSEYHQWLDVAVSMSNNLYYSSSLQPTSYMYSEDSVYNRMRYLGSKLTGPDFNEDSTETIDGGPVVSFIEVDNNEIIV